MLVVRCSLVFARCSLLFACSLYDRKWPNKRAYCFTLNPQARRFYIFVLCVTQWKDGAEWVQYFIFCFCVWCKSRQLGGRVSPRFPCVTPAVESFSSNLLWAIISFWAESLYNSVKHPRWSSPTKVTNGFHTLTISTKELHHRCSARLRMYLWLRVLSMWGVGGLQVYGIYSCSVECSSWDLTFVLRSIFALRRQPGRTIFTIRYQLDYNWDSVTFIIFSNISIYITKIFSNIFPNWPFLTFFRPFLKNRSHALTPEDKMNPEFTQDNVA